METVTDLDAARARLEEEQARLRAELGEEIEAPGQMTYGSQAAAAAQVFAQQRDLAFREQAERRFHADRPRARPARGRHVHGLRDLRRPDLRPSATRSSRGRPPASSAAGPHR